MIKAEKRRKPKNLFLSLPVVCWYMSIGWRPQAHQSEKMMKMFWFGVFY